MYKRQIHYYSAPNGITPVYTLKAGHTYAIWYSEGYGFVTWPTYSRDWRYAQPFLEVDGEEYLNAAIPEEYIDYDKPVSYTHLFLHDAPVCFCRDVKVLCLLLRHNGKLKLNAFHHAGSRKQAEIPGKKPVEGDFPLSLIHI